MPKAKRYRKARLTQAPPPNPNRKKEDGRPKGTYKKFRFEETKLGFFLKYEVPVVYEIVMKLTPPAVFLEPPLYLIDIVCNASKDPSLKKAKFFRYLTEYEEKGLFCNRRKYLTLDRKAYYESIRKKKMGKFICQNKKRIERMKQISHSFLPLVVYQI